MIAGAALLVQGLAKGNSRHTVLPRKMRDILSNPATATPQGSSVAGHIGVLPNLRAIMEFHKMLSPSAADRTRGSRE